LTDPARYRTEYGNADFHAQNRRRGKYGTYCTISTVPLDILSVGIWRIPISTKTGLGRTLADVIAFYRRAYPSPVNIGFVKI